MTAVIQLRPTGEIGRVHEFKTARTLQDLLDTSARVLARLGLDHAVMLGRAETGCLVVLPLLPVMATLEDPMRRALNANVHPAMRVGRNVCEVGVASALQSCCGDDCCKQLTDAFRAVGLRHVYEVPLVEPCEASYTLELGRIGGRLDDDTLRELRVIGQIILSKLPWFVRCPPCGHEEDAEHYEVR